MWFDRRSNDLPLIPTMAPRTLALLSNVLSSAGNVAEALNALSQDVTEHDRNGSIVLFIYDARRDLLAERLIPAP